MSEHSMSNVVHEQLYAKIARQTQERTCDIRDCDIRQPVRKSRMPKIQTSQPAARAILERLDRAGLTQRDLADALGLEENKISKIRRGRSKRSRLRRSGLRRKSALAFSRVAMMPPRLNPTFGLTCMSRFCLPMQAWAVAELVRVRWSWR